MRGARSMIAASFALAWAAIAPARADEIDDFVSAEMARRGIPGLSFAVLRAGAVADLRHYGVSNLEVGAPVYTQ